MGTIVLERITKQFDGHPVLSGIDLDVRAGEFLIVLGASGGGKSTLLNVIAGLLFADSGRILFDGQEVTALDVQQRNVAYVFQDYALYPHMTVEGNIRFPLENMKWSKVDIEQKTEETLDRLQLKDVSDKRPGQLSGGQKQRVAIGRALVREPSVFLFDEPLSSLDPQLRDRLRLELKQLQRQLKKTFIYVTHDAHSAMVLGDRVAFLSGGRIQQVGTPTALYREPIDLEVARFFGFPPLNALTPDVFEKVSGHAVSGEVQRIGIRPEHLVLEPDASGPFDVLWVQPLGHRSFATFRVGDVPVCGACGATSIEEGMSVRVRIDKNYLMFFDAGNFRIAGYTLA